MISVKSNIVEKNISSKINTAKKDKLKKEENRKYKKNQKTVSFYTLGCKVNQYETDVMIEAFKSNGYSILKSSEIPDIFVVNSCSVTNMSTRKTRQFLSKAKKLGSFVVLVGCYAEEISKSGDSSLKNVDLILGNEEKNNIVEIIETHIAKENADLIYVDNIDIVTKYKQNNILTNAINVRESVKIEDGCNNFCSYCIIPHLRGRVRSKSIDMIIREVENLVASGVGEIVLVGIEISSYGIDLENKISLIDVVEAVSRVVGLKRIRLGSIEPRILTEENIIRLSNVQNLCPHFHISVQSLNDRVLKDMNRKYTSEFVKKRISLIRKYIKNALFTCDIIVGFPNETDQEFNNTYTMLTKIPFYEVHVFKYSKRKWTKAANMDGQVDPIVATSRSHKIIELSANMKNEVLKSNLGTVKSVLIESYTNDGYVHGYTSNYIKVKAKGDKSLWGCQLEIELKEIEEDTILGNILI